MTDKKCPGTASINAGKSEACEGCPNKSYCDQPKTIDPDIAIIKNNMKKDMSVYAIMSGKGGVGKSTITRNIAECLSRDSKTLILDLDLCGPSIPKLTKTEQNIVFESNGVIFPIEVTKNLFCLSVGHFLKEKSEVLDSNFKNSIIKKLLKETDFTGFKYLIIDTPPGVSDEHLGIVNLIKLDAVVLATTPQKVSFNDVIRQIDFCNKTKIRIIGIVENMKKYICKQCKHPNYIFSECGVKDFCQNKKINYLGEINIDPVISKNSDQGEFFINKTIEKIANIIIKDKAIS